MKKTKLPSLISILILTVITSVMWVSLSVYRVFTTKPAPAVPNEISDPLTPSLNQKVISEIESKLFFSDSEIPQLELSSSIQPLPTAVPTPIPTPTATESGSPTATASATPTL